MRNRVFIGLLELIRCNAFAPVLSQIRREVMRKNRDPLEIFWRVSPEACRNIEMFTFRRRQLAVPPCSAQSQRSPSGFAMPVVLQLHQGLLFPSPAARRLPEDPSVLVHWQLAAE